MIVEKCIHGKTWVLCKNDGLITSVFRLHCCAQLQHCDPFQIMCFSYLLSCPSLLACTCGKAGSLELLGSSALASGA